MKRFLLTCVALTLITTEANAYDWTNILNVFTNTTQEADTQTTVQNDVLNSLTNIQNQANTIDSTVQENFLSIVSLLSSKKEATSIKSQLKSINSNTKTTESEKSALINQVLSTYASGFVNNSDSVNSIKKLSTSDKIELVKQLASLEQSGQKYASLAKQAITTSAANVLKSSSSASNASADDIASIISQTNQTATLIKERATNTLNFVNQIRTVAKLAGIMQ